MLVKKYDYPKLKRIQQDGSRRYTNGKSDPVPSVTTILDKTSDKSHLIAWRNRVGDAEANRISNESAGLGTKVHDALEKYILKEDWKITGSNFVSQLAQRMVEAMINEGMANVNELWGTEVGLIAEGLYAGTADAVGMYNGRESIIDFKTSKQIKKREWIEGYFCQCTAYSLAHNEMFGSNIRQVVILMVDREANFEKFIIKDDEYDEYCLKWGERVVQYYNS